MTKVGATRRKPRRWLRASVYLLCCMLVFVVYRPALEWVSSNLGYWAMVVATALLFLGISVGAVWALGDELNKI